MTKLNVLYAALFTLALVLASCGERGPSGPNGGLQVVGSYCSATQVSSATRSDTGWRVTIYANVARRENYTDANGYVRERERRSCETWTCVLDNATSLTEREAIDRCADARP